jgi:hypothetical protein
MKKKKLKAGKILLYVHCYDCNFSTTKVEVICIFIIKINGICGVGHVNENKRDRFLKYLSHINNILTEFERCTPLVKH